MQSRAISDFTSVITEITQAETISVSQSNSKYKSTVSLDPSYHKKRLSDSEKLTISYSNNRFQTSKILRQRYLLKNNYRYEPGQVDAETILENLRGWGLYLDNLRGQGYDGARVMSGVISGVQQRILEHCPNACNMQGRIQDLWLGGAWVGEGLKVPSWSRAEPW